MATPILALMILLLCLGGSGAVGGMCLMKLFGWNPHGPRWAFLLMLAACVVMQAVIIWTVLAHVGPAIEQAL